MHALTRLPAALILTDRIVDDAGLFPPEELDMASAPVRHRSDQAISNPVFSQRFVCPAGRFDELHRQLDDGDRIQVIARGPAAPQTQARVCRWTPTTGPRLLPSPTHLTPTTQGG
jgi:hypothetical protein